MKKSILLAPALLGVFALAQLTFDHTNARANPGGKIVVQVITDDQSMDSVKKMKQLQDQLSKGTQFQNSIVNFSLCGPSRATALTGQEAHNHKVLCNGEPEGGWDAFEQLGTAPMWLRDAGWRTILLGTKLMNSYHEHPGNMGFTDYTVMEDHGGAKRFIDPTFDIDGVITPRTGYSTDLINDYLNSYIQQCQTSEQNCYIMVTIAAPHAPAIPAERHKNAAVCDKAEWSKDLGKYPGPGFNPQDMRGKPSFMASLPAYDAKKEGKIKKASADRCKTLLAVDEMMPALINRATDDFMVMYMSDNGMMEGHHRYTGKLLAAYVESHEVPLMIWGGGFQPGAVRKEMVVNTDLVPTILHFAGLKNVATRVMDGRALQNMASGAVPMRTGARIDGLYGLNEDSEGGEGAKKTNCFRTSQAKNAWIYCQHENGDTEFYDLNNRKGRTQVKNLNVDASLRPKLESVKAAFDKAMACTENCYFSDSVF